LTAERQIERGISEIVGALTDPIIVFPGGWGDSLPDWLKTSITLERLTMNIEALKDEQMTGTDAEACAYLMTASLTQPMSSDWSEIYLYVAGQTYKRWGKGEMPADITVASLSNHQVNELNRLKAWLYRQRNRARTERDRAERREKKEEQETKKKEEQPALFEF